MTDDPTTAGPLGEAGARLRALVAKWEDAADWEYNHGDRGFASGLDQCANELRAELDTVVSQPRGELCQGSINGYVACELQHGHKGPCGYAAAPVVTQEGEEPCP